MCANDMNFNENFLELKSIHLAPFLLQPWPPLQHFRSLDHPDHTPKADVFRPRYRMRQRHHDRLDRRIRQTAARRFRPGEGAEVLQPDALQVDHCATVQKRHRDLLRVIGGHHPADMRHVELHPEER